MSDILLQAVSLGELRLKNRIVMAPMTRNRAQADGTPTPMMARYYAQRASAGLIVAEGTWPVVQGQAYCRQPGIQTPEQVRAWRHVTDAVHAEGGLIVLQIMHAGRIGSRHIKPAGVETVAPSALQAQGEVWTDAAGMQPYDAPREMSSVDVQLAVLAHAQAAERAREAGFDGVELHGTSGYLPMQFLSPHTNRRTDEWGGEASGRAYFAATCLRAMAEAWSPGRVGLRINPGNTYNDTQDPDSAATHRALLEQVATLGLAYVHVMRSPDPQLDAFALAASCAAGPSVLNDGFDGDSARAALEAGLGQAVSFGRHFIGNPDLVHRLREALPLARFDRKTLYTPGEAGYCDYPALA